MTKKEHLLSLIEKEIQKGIDPETGSAYCDDCGVPDNWYAEEDKHYIEVEANDDLSNISDAFINLDCYYCKEKHIEPNCECCNKCNDEYFGACV